jgi:glycerol kinase
MLFDINKKCWDPKLCELLDVPMSILPRVVDNCGNFGRVERRRGVPECLVGIPITACAGDQHASLFGQTCFSVGDVKNTYGTGCFALMNTGETPGPSEKLITAIGWSYGGKTTYALEGSVFNAGSTIQWLRDGLGIISSSSEVDLLAESVENSAGVTCVPAFTGLGAPYWDMYARASILGLTRGSSKAHICRAVLEGIAFQVSDLISEMESSAGRKVNRLYVDGGASVSRFMMQFQADILGITVDRPKNVETTALGVAMMAGIGASVLTENELSRMRESDALFDPCLDIGTRLGHLDRWKRAVETTRVYKI